MQLLGAHMSIAGGVSNAIDRGEELGCIAIQIFVKSSQRLFGKALSDDMAVQWHEKLANSSIVQAVIAHAGYMINLASPEQEKWERYIDAMVEEMLRCDILGIAHIVLHPGSPKGKGEKWGIQRVAQAIDRIYESKELKANIALENTAGTGNNIGWRFEHLRDMIALSKYGDRLGVALDTCHAYAAGYDLTNEEKYHRVWEEFEKIIGFARLVALHLNDSKHPLGSHKDRHAHIGCGHLGRKPFEFILNDERFIHLPKVLETPKEDDWDRKNLGLLWKLAGEKSPVNLDV